MRQIIIALAILLGCSFCFAQVPEVPKVSPGAADTSVVKIMLAKVVSVTIADAAKGTNAEITVVDSNGNQSTFVVKSTATIYDADLKASSLDNIKKDDSVKIKYITSKKGVKEAVAVNLNLKKE